MLSLFKKITYEEVKREKFLLTFMEFLHMYTNKKQSYFLEDFLNGTIQKRNKHLRFRKNGDVDWDKNSKNPYFVEYNNTRLEIKEWMRTTKPIPYKGYYEFTGNFSSSLWEAFQKDGFHVYNMEYKNSLGHTDVIALVSEIPWKI